MLGVPIVTDLHFWKEDPAWKSNRSFLHERGALLIEGVNVFDVIRTLRTSSPCFLGNLSDIGLVVIGGFHPHYLMPAVVQALAHQLPHSDILMLYASRDAPPEYQDKNLVHIQAWTADAANGYVIRRGGQGIGGTCRCFSAESKQRNVFSDPSLVKISAFTHSLANVQLVGAQISPAGTVHGILNSGRHVLFCCEGDASLATSCLRPPPQPCIVHNLPSFHRYFPSTGKTETYAAFLRRAIDEGKELANAAHQWAQAWPTTMPTATSQPFVSSNVGDVVEQTRHLPGVPLAGSLSGATQPADTDGTLC